jgi:hypothetical protein
LAPILPRPTIPSSIFNLLKIYDSPSGNNRFAGFEDLYKLLIPARNLRLPGSARHHPKHLLLERAAVIERQDV